MKKMFLAIVLLLVYILPISAQSEMYEWEVFSAFDNPAQIVEARNNVYAVAGGFLYCYDKEYNELQEINRKNILSDTEVSVIDYDAKSDILVVAYSNSNIDIISRGVTYNIPYIKEAVMTSEKGINNINFVPERNEIYISTDFGIVIINTKKFEIKTTFDIGEKIFDATYMAGRYYMLDGDKNLCSCSEEEVPYVTENWRGETTFSTQPANLLLIGDALWVQSEKEISCFTPDEKKSTISNGTYSSIALTGNGDIYTYGNKILTIFGEDKTQKSKITLSTALGYAPVSLSNNNKSNIFWMLSDGGFASYKLLDDDNQFAKNDTIPVIDKLAVSTPYSLTISGGTLYAVPMGICIDNEEQNYPYNNISYLKDYSWHNIYGDNVPSPKDKPSFVTKFMLPSKLAIHPQNDEVAYVGTWFDGLYMFEKGEYKQNWNYMNSPIDGAADNWVNQLSCLSFDESANLWMTSYSSSQGVLILKPNGEWIVYEHVQPLINQKYMACMLHPKQSGTKWFVTTDGGNPFVVALNINGTLEDTADDKYKKFSTFTDQDGKTIDAKQYFCIEEDRDGKIWIGTDRGPIILSRPDNFAAQNFTCSRVKIPRNDGTNNADLLLDDEIIRAIRVDGANCKWIGTFGNGAYLLSEDGLETISHFTTENSMLPSNNIYDIAINQITGEVYFATDKGLVSFRAEAAMEQENYDNIYAFPNPVRPEHTGVITITGLMFNSLVKITDTTGNLIYQGYSQGGQAVWSGNNSNGERVKSGVYYVWASSEDGKEGIVTKIVFIN